MVTAKIRQCGIEVAIHDDYCKETSGKAADEIMREIGRIISCAYCRTRSTEEEKQGTPQ